jgi:hypothetical protein
MAELIDPHFDKIPADEVSLTETERAALLHGQPSRGLSINDTIARDANLSIGSTGVSTSGIPSGVSPEEQISDTPTVDDSPVGSDE